MLVGDHVPAMNDFPAVAVDVRPEPWLKRPIDVLLAAIGLVLSSPLWLVAALAIKLASRGPVLFKQRRWGRGGSPFVVYKFRTMKAVGPDAAIVPRSPGDERVTAPGRLLRATGMDELPQFINILRGDMSLVGPRALAVGETLPEQPDSTYEEMEGFADRLAVRPGLTGVATVYLPRDATPQEKFAADLDYVRNQSTLLDLRLIALSLWISIRGKWESPSRKF